MKRYRKQDNWDLPDWMPKDWEEVKLYGQGFLSSVSPLGPAATLPVVATLSTKKAIEKSTGQKMSTKDVNDLLIYNQKETGEVLKASIDKNIVGPVVNFFGNIKLILLVVLLIVIFIKFK